MNAAALMTADRPIPLAVGAVMDDYDKVWQIERDEDQALWDDAQDEASRDRAEQFEHTEDVP